MSSNVFDNFPGGGKSSNGPRATNGGKCEPKPLPYDPPVGPTAQMQKGPGLHGTNHGPSGGQQGKH